MLAPRQHPLPERGLEGCCGLQRQNVIDQELQAALALVLVYIESVNELHGAFRGDEAVALFDVVERNCIE